MSNEQAFDPHHPRLSDACVGHSDAERSLLEAFNGERLHHAWLITGARGIGKATLAYRFAKFMLVNGNVGGDGPSMFGDDLGPTTFATLEVDPENDVIQRIKAGGHGDLLTVERSEDPKKKVIRKQIIVDDVRKAHTMFHSTASEGGWRVIVVDAADEMNRNAANALLKILEEPPEKAILLLVSHAPGKLLPTIRSRCRMLKLSPLERDAVRDVVMERFPDMGSADIAALSALAEGAPGKAIRLADMDGLTVYDRMLGILGSLPNLDIPVLHKLAGEMSAAKANDKYELFMDLLGNWLERLVRYGATSEAPFVVRNSENAIFQQLTSVCGVDRWLEVWEKMNNDRIRAAAVNMDKKQLLLELFSTMSECASGK